MEKRKSRILIIGATGNLGFQLAKASLEAAHPTFALVRDSAPSDPTKAHKLHTLSDAGATLLKVAPPTATAALCFELWYYEMFQRYIPSEFGVDPDKTKISDLDHGFYLRKAEIRRLVEAEGIPYTYICCNFFTSYLLPSLVQPDLKTPPRDKAIVFGDGKARGVFVKEGDVAAFTISTVDDPRTLNKVLYLRPPGNVCSMNDLVEMWETKIKKKLDKIYMTEEELLKKIKGMSIVLAGVHGDVCLTVFWPHPSPSPPPYTRGPPFQSTYHHSTAMTTTFRVTEAMRSTLMLRTTVVIDIDAEAMRSTSDGAPRMAEKSKILVIGGTGYIGKFIVEASAKAGHPTFALVRDSTLSDPSKSSIIDGFKSSGVTLLQGDLYDHESLVKAIKQVDVVISTVGSAQLGDQGRIIAAIKEAGNVKRFFPSEFGNDVDRTSAVEPAKTAFATKAQIRRAVEAEGIPHTYVSSNFFAGYFLPTLSQPGVTAPPRDKVIILGDGNPKESYPNMRLTSKLLWECALSAYSFRVSIFNKEDDIATYTIKAVDDPRTLNKILYIRAPANIYSFNELVSLWEKKIGKTLERIYVPEEQVLKNIQGKLKKLTLLIM
ncbi:hypothetical protein RJ640_016400 [Escallonia rubra]|uniref:NmrA-like domain-containing protein n=1 Tax=Escallonia rubra TaxID=112253 RepID=A0AA88UNJ6_9ASTE|nr:hypothetical protein RJ640_016400 [Escallonia rubra]